MDRTITALYDTKDEAEAAKEQILDCVGGGNAHVKICGDEGDAPASRESTLAADDQGRGHDDEGFIDKLKHFFMADDDRHAYSEGMRRGGCLLTARVDEAYADEVCRLLDSGGAVDMEARQRDWTASGWDPQRLAGSADDRRDAAGMGADGTDRIPVAEERFRLGKREVERGTVRVRSYIEEQPVHEQIDLDQERGEVERRPVDRTLSPSEADGLFRERTIEMTERGEEAVVAKEAVVTEEIALRKEADRRTETIDDTVRRTRVDIDDDRKDGADRSAGGRGLDEGRSFGGRERDMRLESMDDRSDETEEDRLRRSDPQRGDRPLP